MKAGALRRRLVAGVEAALRSGTVEDLARAADRAKVTGAAIAGVPDESSVEVAELDLPTRSAATVLGFHPEHVRRLVRRGRLQARRAGGDYRLRVDDLWPLIEARYRPPGARRSARDR